MHAVLVTAFKAGATHLIGAVEIVDIATPQLLKLLAERIVDVRTEETVERLGSQLTNVAAQLVATYLRKLREIFGEAAPDIGSPVEGNLNLAARGGDDAAPRGKRQHTEVIMTSLVDAPAEICQGAGRGHLHDVALPGALVAYGESKGDALY